MKQSTYRNLTVALAAAFLGLVILMSCGDGGEAKTAAAGGPGPVIVIAVDGLRADALGCYGAPAATPAFDALAAESVRFEWAFAQAPQAAPSLAALFSGLYPTTNGLRSAGDYLADDAVTLAEALGGAGFATAAFVEGAPASSDYGLAQGFDAYRLEPSPGDSASRWLRDNAHGKFLMVLAGWSRAGFEQVSALLAGSGRPEGMEQRLQEVLASRSGGVPLAFDEADLEWARVWYAARVQVIDAQLASFIEVVRELGLDRRATLVVLGSSGFALQEHGELFGESLYPAVTHVPVLIRFPGGAKASVVSKTVEVVDLMPTILELAGTAVPAGVQGASLVPIIDGGGQPPYVAFAESPQGGGQRFVSLGGMAMVSGISGDSAQLFDLGADPQAVNDLAASEADKLEVMVRHLQAWEKMVSVASLDPSLRTEEDLDEETLKQLKSLGYIQ